MSLEAALRAFLSSESDDEAGLRGARMNATHAGVSREQIAGVLERVKADVAEKLEEAVS